ncbi:hypothetical protein H5410_000987 [Solanum commersonii]|uniref:Leucine-rich repeat-containing N-terminal plant-type domain-containing protein n=1 Tax=Solanum commersonii TaxID=4109 RepID=A0A9J6AXL5_SOLCO|nr:hypothetical protein H5410_000987 [Solanum commersonii]
MKVLAITLWVLLLFILTNTKFVVCVGICRDNEQRALETLKKEIHDPSDILSSWIVGKDCCEWEGVVCNNLTRHVIELSIYSPLFPMWLRTQKKILNVDISDGGIQGEVPLGFGNCLLKFDYSIFLTTNLLVRFQSSRDNEQSGYWILMYLASNNFSGPLPLISTNVRELDLSNNSFQSYLNLSDNNLLGMIPLSTQLQSFDPTSFQGNKFADFLLVNEFGW